MIASMDHARREFWAASRALLVVTALVTTPIVDAAPGIDSEPIRGVTADPCRGVPLEPTAAHKATSSPFDSWVHDKWLRHFVAQERIVYADYYAVLTDGQGGIKATLSEDGVHPNAAGYAAMRPVAQAAVRQALSRRVRLQ